MGVRRRHGALLLAVLGVAGCSGGTAPATAPLTPSASAVAPGGPRCAAPASAGAAFPALPKAFPTDFPAPPGAGDAVADDRDPVVVAVRFPSPLSLEAATRFVVTGLPQAGFRIVGGDREPHEADIVFSRADLRGQLRIAAVTDCTTYWLVQVRRPR